MDIRKVLIIPFALGLFLFAYAWLLTYPIALDNVQSNIFNDISIYYWISLPLLVCSMFLMALFSKSNILKWILTVGIISVLYSISYL
jgi:hypothetical protein